MHLPQITRFLFMTAALACFVMEFLSGGKGWYFGSAILFVYAAQLFRPSRAIDILPFLYRLSRGLSIGVPLALILCVPLVFTAPYPKEFIPIYFLLTALSALMFSLSTALEKSKRMS